MRAKKTIVVILLTLTLGILISGIITTYAGELGGKEQAALDITIDTKDLTGINLWIVEMYNNDRTLYAIVVTMVMATLGSVMAFGTDLILKYFGMGVGRISHSE
ncbi:MAG TPA: hypothetical protein VKD08_07990 [Ignavibacteriaceae bacterium]|jgi:hypothetical protein|nr:hypothetical protein [Ignavibacteriaceae bacterium]